MPRGNDMERSRRLSKRAILLHGALVEGADLLYGIKPMTTRVSRLFSERKGDSVLYNFGYMDSTRQEEQRFVELNQPPAVVTIGSKRKMAAGERGDGKDGAVPKISAKPQAGPPGGTIPAVEDQLLAVQKVGDLPEQAAPAKESEEIGDALDDE